LQTISAKNVTTAGELGVDLECTRQGELQILLIAVKKRPNSKDLEQLRAFANQNGTKIDL
jgi:hypothetical protein